MKVAHRPSRGDGGRISLVGRARPSPSLTWVSCHSDMGTIFRPVLGDFPPPLRGLPRPAAAAERGQRARVK